MTVAKNERQQLSNVAKYFNTTLLNIMKNLKIIRIKRCENLPLCSNVKAHNLHPNTAKGLLQRFSTVAKVSFWCSVLTT